MLEDLYTLSRKYLDIHYKSYQRTSTNDPGFLQQRLSILIGQRGVGKTTAIIQWLLRYAANNQLSRDILYIPVDHFIIAGRALYEIAEQFVQLGGKVLAFDEIHKYGNWSQELKSIYDTFPDLKIVASGSSALEIPRGSHDLTRRAILYKLHGLSLREYLELDLNLTLPSIALDDILRDHEKIAVDIVERLAEHEVKILQKFMQYLQIGYFPYFLEIRDPNAYWLTLEQNFHAIVESDLPAIHSDLTGNSIRKIKALLMFIARAVPFTPQWKKIKTILDIGDERTLKTYFKYLEDAELIRLLPKGVRKINALETPEKIYLNNTNQLYALSTQEQNSGTVRETFFLSMLATTHEVTAAKMGDFSVDGKITFEVGGKNKDFTQIKNIENGFLACDNLEIGIGKKIPLWLFGFLY